MDRLRNGWQQLQTVERHLRQRDKWLFVLGERYKPDGDNIRDFHKQPGFVL